MLRLDAWKQRRWPADFSKKAAVVTFFVLFFVIGLRSFGDYGIPYDEGTMMQLGRESYAYAFEHRPYPEDTHIRFHGTAVELPLYALTQVVGPLDNIQIAYLRRFAVFCFFFLGVLSFFFVAQRIIGDWRMALIGCAFFVLSPRVFAHGFYNSRDIPTLALFTLAILTLLRLVEKPSAQRSVIHGIVCGLVIGIRMPALFLIPLTLFILALEVIRQRPFLRSLQSVALCIGIFLLSLFATTYAMWPLLWEHPVMHFLDAYRFMSSIESPVMFLGRVYQALPWFYIPLWILFTTPWLYSLLFLLGCSVFIVRIVRGQLHPLSMRVYPILLPFLWFFIPPVFLILSHAGIYQEWRHILFLYPGFLLIALMGLDFLTRMIGQVRSTRAMHRLVLAGCLFIFVPLASTAAWMFRNHPYENVYYAVPREWISTKLDLDYWGLSLRQAMQYVVEHDSRPFITFYSPHNLTAMDAYVFFQTNLSMRVVHVTSPQLADYVIELHQPTVPSAFSGYEEVHSITVDGMKLVSVYEGNSKARAFMDTLRSAKAEDRLRLLLSAGKKLDSAAYSSL